VLGAIGDWVRRSAALTTLRAGRVAVQDELADEVEPFDCEPAKVYRVPRTEAFCLTGGETLLNDLLVKGRLKFCARRSKAAGA
jgi:hypothetical protein